MYCTGGKICLPSLLQLPPYLLYLYTLAESDANLFCQNIRAYNTILACISFSININRLFSQGISNFRIHGQIYYHIRSLLSKEPHPSKFA